MRLLILSGLASASLLLVPVTAAQQIPERGTAFIFDDGRVERFVRQDGAEMIWATRRGREYVRSANPAEPILAWQVGERKGRREVFGNPDALLPITAGKRARFRVLTEVEAGGRSRRSVQPWTCRIGNRERQEVGAGTFETLPIICERFSVNTMRLMERRTWWWSEDIGHYVRRRYQNLRDGSARDIRLCAALPGSRASEARIEVLREQKC